MQNRNEQTGRWARRIRLALGAGAAAALMIPISRGDRGFAAEALWNSMHFPAGWLIAWAMTHSERLSGWSRSARWAWAAVALALFECIQPVVGRTFSASDLFAGLCGWGAAGWLLLCPFRRTAYIAALILAMVSFRLPALALYDHVRIRRTFPLMADFEDRLQLNRWVFRQMDYRLIGDGKEHDSYLRLCGRNKNRHYPGMFSTAFPADWTAFEKMKLNVFIHANEKELWFRFDDLPDEPPYSDRSQFYFPLTQGAHFVIFDLREKLVTPSGRALNLENIQRFGIFFNTLETNEAVCIDKIMLE